MLNVAKEFKEHQMPYDVPHRGAEDGGAAYFGKGKPFGYFSTTSGGWELDGEPYTVGEGSEFRWFRSRILGGRTNHYGDACRSVFRRTISSPIPKTAWVMTGLSVTKKCRRIMTRPSVLSE